MLEPPEKVRSYVDSAACIPLFWPEPCSVRHRRRGPAYGPPPPDLDRYMGEWYEIARFGSPFRRGMTAVRARYMRRPEGIEVVNSGLRAASGRRKVRGKACTTSDPGAAAGVVLLVFLFRLRRAGAGRGVRLGAGGRQLAEAVVDSVAHAAIVCPYARSHPAARRPPRV